MSLFPPTRQMVTQSHFIKVHRCIDAILIQAKVQISDFQKMIVQQNISFPLRLYDGKLFTLIVGKDALYLSVHFV